MMRVIDNAFILCALAAIGVAGIVGVFGFLDGEWWMAIPLTGVIHICLIYFRWMTRDRLHEYKAESLEQMRQIVSLMQFNDQAYEESDWDIKVVDALKALTAMHVNRMTLHRMSLEAGNEAAETILNCLHENPQYFNNVLDRILSRRQNAN